MGQFEAVLAIFQQTRQRNNRFNFISYIIWLLLRKIQFTKHDCNVKILGGVLVKMLGGLQPKIWEDGTSPLSLLPKQYS